MAAVQPIYDPSDEDLSLGDPDLQIGGTGTQVRLHSEWIGHSVRGDSQYKLGALPEN